MTDTSKPVTRTTTRAYRFTVVGAYPDDTGRKVVTWLGAEGGLDVIRMREAGRRKWVEVSIADLYARALTKGA